MFSLMEEQHLPAVLQLCNTRFSPPLTELMVRSCMRLHSAWVAVDDGEVRGFYLLAPSPPAVQRILALAAAVDGEGWGRRLGEHVVAQARASGVSRLTCEVADSNVVARRMYARFGAVEIGRRPHYYTHDDGATEDAIVMSLTL